MFSEKEIFIGIGLFVVIGSLLAIYFVLNSDDVNSNRDLPDTKKESGITGKIINLLSEKEKNYCGDGYCYIDEDGEYENCNICPSDCGSCSKSNSCGDKICSNGECNTCFSDCSLLECENGICEENKGEDCSITPNDCKCGEDSYCDKGICTSLSCGNGICEENKGESCQSCTQDCGFCDCKVLGGNSCEIGQDCKGELKNGCCLGTCEWKWQYPLVFVHGHSKDELGSRYSISTFNEFQDKLISDGIYIEREPIIASHNEYDFIKNQWANSELPISIRTTYYLGEYSKNSEFIYRDNNQNIEEYAKRLGKIIDLVRYTTGREKVDIVAHSMGGLVAREYIIQTEGKYVNKLITIGTPNNGIYGHIAFGCENTLGVGFGREQHSPECEEMQYNSSFIKSLDEDNSYRNRYLTISGKAFMEKETWGNTCYYKDINEYHDEVICASSVYLDGAKNDYVMGKRSNDYLHNDLVLPSKSKDVYDKTIEFLKG